MRPILGPAPSVDFGLIRGEPAHVDIWASAASMMARHLLTAASQGVSLHEGVLIHLSPLSVDPTGRDILDLFMRPMHRSCSSGSSSGSRAVFSRVSSRRRFVSRR